MDFRREPPNGWKTIFDAAIIDGEGGLATLGGDPTQDLLPEPVEAYVASLF